MVPKLSLEALPRGRKNRSSNENCPSISLPPTRASSLSTRRLAVNKTKSRCVSAAWYDERAESGDGNGRVQNNPDVDHPHAADRSTSLRLRNCSEPINQGALAGQGGTRNRSRRRRLKHR